MKKRSATVIAVWRTSSPDLDVDALVREFALEPDALWHKGDPSRRKPESESGLNLDVARSRSTADAVQESLRFVEQNRELLSRVHALGASSVLDLGVMVGSETSFAPSVRLSRELLLACLEQHVELHISCYPVGCES